jgi:hypothetical protein
LARVQNGGLFYRGERDFFDNVACGMKFYGAAFDFAPAVV